MTTPATPATPAELQLETSGLESAAGSAPVERRFPTLDGYRALAALAVVVTHVGFYTGAALRGHAASFLSRLDIGVPIFFALSGFLLYRPMLLAEVTGRARPGVPGYLLRRLQRVGPAYWISVAVVLLVVAADHRGLVHPGEWLRQLFLIWPYSAGHKYRALDQNWSLSAEVAFYALLPFWPRLLAPIRRRVRRWWRVELTAAAVLIAVTTAWIVVWHRTQVVDSNLAGYWLPSHLDWFAVGLALATVNVAATADVPRPAWLAGLRDLADSPGTCWALAGAVFVLVMTPLAGPWDYTPATAWQAVFKELLYAAFAGIFLLPGCLGDQVRGWPRRLMSARPLQRLGLASYGLFLFHQAVIEVIYRVWGIPLFSGRFPQILGMTLLFSGAVAFLSLYLVELPVLSLRRRLAPASAAA